MRIVQVANFYGPRSGGLRTAVDQLGLEYRRCGHEVYLLVPGPRDEAARLASGVNRISLKAWEIPFTGGYRAIRVAAAVRILENLRPDAIEVSDRFTLRPLGRWGARAGVRTVMVSHERLDRLTGQILPWPLARRVADAANRRTVTDYDTVLCTTAFARAEFERIGADNLHTVSLGVDLDTFHPRRYCQRARQKAAGPHRVLLVHCGRLSIEKRVDRSIDTLAVLRERGVDARLVIAGDGPLRKRLQRQASGLPVCFTGFIDSRLAVARLLAVADVAIAPGPHETFGLAALEALACGTPAVVSRTSALAEILTPDSGASADNDPRSLADGIARVLARPAAQRRIDARRRAESFTWPAAAAGMLRALNSEVQRRPA